jgi:hypothetical protein
MTQRRRPPTKTIPRETVREVAAQLRDVLAAAKRGELVGQPGLVPKKIVVVARQRRRNDISPCLV